MEPMRSILTETYLEALKAVDPRRVVREAVRLDGSTLTIGSHVFADVTRDDIVVVALGKASLGMAMGAFDAVGSTRGLVVSPVVGEVPFEMCVGSHPIPGSESLTCGEALLAAVESTSVSDVVLFLVSGGGSSLAVAPKRGYTLDDVVTLNRELVTSGLPVDAINARRAGVSRIKGGGLAAATGALRRATLIISDVVGAGPEYVASGPTLSTPPTMDQLYEVVASPAMVASRAAETLESRGFEVSLASEPILGDAQGAAVAFVEATKPGTVRIGAGEATVHVTGSGLGGRNQHAALAVAIDIEGSDVTFAALGTDGIDGPTRAAGAVVDGNTAIAARNRGLDAQLALARDDSHTALNSLGATLVTGRSGTNVADLWMAARGPFPSL